MNTLSCLLYAADVIPNVGTAFVMFAIATFFAIGGGVLAGGLMRDYKSHDSEEWKTGVALQKKSLKFIWVIPVCILIAVVIPGKSTIYMIAASEMGETVVTNPEVKEIFDAMKAKVKEYLAVEESDK
jgi:ABC-type methionine transport system permease subunit